MSDTNLNYELLNELQYQAQDKHGETDQYEFAKLIAQHAIAITHMRQYRNGPDSAENQVIRKIRNDLMQYFGIEDVDVNEIFNENELFREYFKLPKLGDRTWPSKTV